MYCLTSNKIKNNFNNILNKYHLQIYYFFQKIINILTGIMKNIYTLVLYFIEYFKTTKTVEYNFQFRKKCL